jgi:sigma-B regulation protein RsbU (phosphoserine phosphatase)
LTILANTSAMAIHNAQMAEDLLFQERTYRELELAREIQTALLPGNSNDYPVYGVNVPARVVSGDFYDHFQLDDGRICFGLGDVAGKGINAALLMAKTTSLFRCLGKQLASPAALLDSLNTELYANATHGMFVTMVAGIYDPSSRQVVLVNAGHHAPILMYDDGSVKELSEAGIPLGIEPQVDLQEQSVDLQDCDLYIYTDGLSECWFQQGLPLGSDGVHDLISWHRHKQPAQRLQAIIEQATQWKRDYAGYLFDDVTMLMISPPRGA